MTEVRQSLDSHRLPSPCYSKTRIKKSKESKLPFLVAPPAASSGQYTGRGGRRHVDFAIAKTKKTSHDELSGKLHMGAIKDHPLKIRSSASEREKILLLKITVERAAIESKRKICEEIDQDLRKLVNEIDEMDAAGHRKGRLSINEYSKLRRTFLNNRKFNANRMQELQSNINQINISRQTLAETIREDNQQLDEELTSILSQIRHFQEYEMSCKPIRDKEIEKLESQLSTENAGQLRMSLELEHLIHMETNRLKVNKDVAEKTALNVAVERASKEVSAKTISMMGQNRQMQIECSILRKQHAQLVKNTERLKGEILILKQECHRLCSYATAKTVEVCDSDTEINLDIPLLPELPF